jgi:glucose/mannose-6-phosphate isomerase
MLDDLKQIHFLDKSDALGLVEKQWQQLTKKFDIPEIEGKFENIVFAGMGGSALAARISLTWPSYTIPFEISSDYDIPKYVSDKTLFIASSYSGNTEETVLALEQARKQNATIVVISSGGKLEEMAIAFNLIHISLPPISSPRFGTFYSLKALVTVLERAGLVKVEQAETQLHSASEHIHRASDDWLPTVRSANNRAKKIALDIMGTSPVIYSGPMLWPVAYKWKISINENSKNLAWANQFPEFSHNEFMGWSSHPIDKVYSVIDLRTNLEHPQIKKRFSLTEKMLSGKRPHPITINAKGENILEQMLWTIALGDFVSIYLALLNNIDPTQVKLLEKFKKEL